MDINKITAIISSHQASIPLSLKDINDCIAHFPFASALYALRCQVQSVTGIPVQDLADASCHLTDRESLIDKCVAQQVSIKQQKQHAESSLPDSLVNRDSSENQNSDDQSQSEAEANLSLTTDRDSQARRKTDDPKSIHNQDSDKTEQGKDSDLTLGGVEHMSDQSTTKVNTSLLELEHLSAYSSWLLQLKKVQSPNMTVKAENHDVNKQVDSPESSANPLEKSTNEEVISSKLIDKSSSLNDQIVSESLANLLAEQGYRKKAIAMYKKLSLIIPEKNAYFAAQIEKIKEK